MEKTGFKVKKRSAAGGILRRGLIFVLVAAAIGTGIWFLLPHPEKEPEKPVPAESAIPAKETAPAVIPEPVSEPEEKTFTVSSASKETPAPAEDPELTVEKTPEKTPEKMAAQEPVRKGIVHASDPAEEEPYSAPDLVPATEFTAKLAAIRAASGTEQMTKLQALLKETAFASPQFRETAKVLNECTRELPVSSVQRTVYVVKPGDSLIRLARKFHLPTVRLAAENGLEANAMLKIGQKLQVPEKAEWWSIRISKRARLLCLYREKELFAVYDVGIGRRDLTPEGNFILRETVDDPPYPLPAGGMAKPGSPENQLGPCWLGLGDSRLRSTGYGIHGTPDESSVTRNLSAGCVRMRNKEVLELRARVPVGTPVVIAN
ncbi:MAG: L,D-transpeptidase family protein [Lentisphaeria bacterium]|nr:L,D-transpeptidase family protein [Lentisphaeria bacterium]